MQSPSGRFVLRLPAQLHLNLKQAAGRKGLSLNQLCAEILRTGLTTSRTSEAASSVLAGSDLLPGAVLKSLQNEFRDQLEGVVLFGSAARGDMWADSDIDLLIVLKQRSRITRDLYRIWDRRIAAGVESLLHKVSPQFVSMPSTAQRAGSIWFEVALEGIVLIDPSLRISRLLADLRQGVLLGRVIRKTRHGLPYWVRISAHGEVA